MQVERSHDSLSICQVEGHRLYLYVRLKDHTTLYLYVRLKEKDHTTVSVCHLQDHTTVYIRLNDHTALYLYVRLKDHTTVSACQVEGS